jgi:hypothetical protein
MKMIPAATLIGYDITEHSREVRVSVTIPQSIQGPGLCVCFLRWMLPFKNPNAQT